MAFTPNCFRVATLHGTFLKEVARGVYTKLTTAALPAGVLAKGLRCSKFLLEPKP